MRTSTQLHKHARTHVHTQRTHSQTEWRSTVACVRTRVCWYVCVWAAFRHVNLAKRRVIHPE